MTLFTAEEVITLLDIASKVPDQFAGPAREVALKAKSAVDQSTIGNNQLCMTTNAVIVYPLGINDKGEAVGIKNE